MDNLQQKDLKGIIESLIFVSEKPLLLEQIKEVMEDVDIQDIRNIILELKNELELKNSGITILEIAGGYQMSTNPTYSGYIKKFYKSRNKEKLSIASLETLGIIAYKQPLTRLDIESIRGVNVDGVIANLLEKGLIKIAGRKDVVGRPFVYGTTRQFLEYFGLKSLDDLPKIDNFSQIQSTLKEAQDESKGTTT